MNIAYELVVLSISISYRHSHSNVPQYFSRQGANGTAHAQNTANYSRMTVPVCACCIV